LERACLSVAQILDFWDKNLDLFPVVRYQPEQ
jgi:hypothetical protein